ncbi:MAG TPA: hypothetical protein VFC63_05635 [Blastocatellia bacterium]|nr:hypothetical protein [Blastocatellia bacterium]
MKFSLSVTTMPIIAASPSFGWRQPELLIWFDGVHEKERIFLSEVQDQPDTGGALLVVHQNDHFSGVSRRCVTWKEREELYQLLQGSGLPWRQPRLKGQHDTSGLSVQVYLTGEVEGNPFSMELQLMNSSYTGQDSKAFAAFCRYLFWLANLKRKGGTSGYFNERLWRTLTSPASK